MNILRVITSKTEADMVVGLLRANGIEAFINGSREYASVVTGHDFGHYEIMVDPEDVAEATEILGTIEPSVPVVRQVVIHDAASSLKRAILFGVMAAIILPIIFNYVSIKNLIRYYEASEKVPKTYVWTAVIILLNFVTLFSMLLFAQFILP